MMNETMNNEVMVQENEGTELMTNETEDRGMTFGQGATVVGFGGLCAVAGYFGGKAIEKGWKWFKNRKKKDEQEAPDVRSIIADLVAKGLINKDTKVTVNDNNEIVIEDVKEVEPENNENKEG